MPTFGGEIQEANLPVSVTGCISEVMKSPSAVEGSHSSLRFVQVASSLPATGRTIRLGVDRNDLVRAVQQGLEVFGGKFRGTGKNDAQWLSHEGRLIKRKRLAAASL